jgi:hypothetical protein
VTPLPTPVPPLFLRDPQRRELLAFPSAEAAAGHLRPWQEVGGVAAWDAEGRRIGFGLDRVRARVLGIVPRWREVVVLREVEGAPDHAAELRAALVAALAATGEPAQGTALALSELVRRAARRCWRGPTAPP